MDFEKRVKAVRAAREEPDRELSGEKKRQVVPAA
jgi:hypothetical protein